MMAFIRSTIAALALASLAGGSSQLLAAQPIEGVSIQSYELQSRARAGRTAYNFTYAVTVNNEGPEATNVIGEVVSSNPGAIVIDGLTSFDSLAPDSQTSSIDTITIRIDRRAGFRADQLTWSFEGDLPVAAVSVLSGRVTAADGSPVDGAMVDITADGSEPVVASTNSAGRFSVEVPAETAFTINVNARFFGTGVAKVVTADAGGTLDVPIVLAPVAFEQSDVLGSVVETPQGVVVLIEPSDFDIPPGAALDVAIATVDVSQPAELLAFPGAFEGVEGGVLTPIASFGTSEISFTSDGIPVDVRDGELVAIELPLFIPTYPDGTLIQLGDQIPVWSLNEDTGIWLAEAVGTVVESENSPTGLALAAEVSHFSWWNADIALETGTVDVSIGGDRPGRATVRATTSAQIAWGGPSTRTTIPVGQTLEGLVVPAGAQTCLDAVYTFNDGSTFTTEEICVQPASGENIDVEFTTPNLPDGLLIGASRVEISSRVGRLAPRVDVGALTIETAVSYTATDVPAGLQLRSSGNTTADLTGRFTASGSFTTTITGVDSDGNTSAVDVTYNIAEIPVGSDGPDFGDFIEIIGNRNTSLYDLNDFNDGGVIVSWSIEGTGPYGGVSTVDNNGIIDIASYGSLYFEPFGPTVFIGTITATAANGESQVVDVFFTPDYFQERDCNDFDDFFCEVDTIGPITLPPPPTF